MFSETLVPVIVSFRLAIVFSLALRLCFAFRSAIVIRLSFSLRLRFAFAIVIRLSFGMRLWFAFAIVIRVSFTLRLWFASCPAIVIRLSFAMRWWSVRFVLRFAIVVRLLAGFLRLLFASCVAIVIRRSFLVGLLFVFCDCDAPAILDSLAPFAKLFASLTIFLLMLVVRQRLLSCSSETALALLSILIRMLLNILLWCLPCDRDRRDCYSRCVSLVPMWEPMIIMS